MSMDELHHLNVADVLALHAAIMERFGLAPAPLHDEGLLESAVMRPRMAAYYSEADLIRQAALLAVGISQAQAFLDGNKRTAFAACDVFLRLNGLAIAGDSLKLAEHLEAVAVQSINPEEATDQFEHWLRKQVAPKDDG